MKRNPEALTRERFDVVVIGGGIYGAAAVWDAALRGLSAALIERDDFAARTSANSLKIVHGGLRYLQTLDFKRMRESIRERRTLTRIAPQLVRPLPCLLPTSGELKYQKFALAAALRITDWIGCDRNEGLDAAHQLPDSRILSRGEFHAIYPEIQTPGLTGAALWYDCQIQNTERLVLAFVRSAVEKNAKACNHLEAVKIEADSEGCAVNARDGLDGREHLIRARAVINMAGPWVNELAGCAGEKIGDGIPMSKAMNLVVRKPIARGYALGFYRPGGQALFAAPWKDLTMIGTWHLPHSGGADRFRITEPDIESFLKEINLSHPSAKLARKDVVRVYAGMLPGDEFPAGSGKVRLKKHYGIVDHGERGGLRGFYSVVGVKYTTARDVAGKTLDQVSRKLGRGGPCMTERVPLIATETAAGFEDQLRRAAREEMAVKLSDAVFRRTELGYAGHPGERALQSAADILAAELGWDPARKQAELADCAAQFSWHDNSEKAVAR